MMNAKLLGDTTVDVQRQSMTADDVRGFNAA
jgi:hypothetical protein